VIDSTTSAITMTAPGIPMNIQNPLVSAKYDLPGFLNPRKYLARRGPLKSPYSMGEPVSGEDVWDHVVHFWDDINGTKGLYRNVDDLDRRFTQAGILGFSPRDFEAAQAFLLYQRGWSKEKIHEAVMEIGRYGLGRSAAEKSANFVFFPFSFSKKLVMTSRGFHASGTGANAPVARRTSALHGVRS
jgi:hypothetical protein